MKDIYVKSMKYLINKRREAHKSYKINVIYAMRQLNKV